MRSCLPVPTNITSSTQVVKKVADNFKGNQQYTDKYCWTHGACGHHGKNCRGKAQGHKDAATFEDKVGGSKAHCKEWRREPDTQHKYKLDNKLLASSTIVSDSSIKSTTCVAKGDSAASHHYWRTADTDTLYQLRDSSKQGEIPLSEFLTAAG